MDTILVAILCAILSPLPIHPFVSLFLSFFSFPVILAAPHSSTQPPLGPPTLGTLTRTFLPQIASHLYSVVLYATTRTDGSHSWLLNYAQTFLDSESKREWRMWTHERSRPQTDSLDPALCDWLEFHHLLHWLNVAALSLSPSLYPCYSVALWNWR